MRIRVWLAVSVLAVGGCTAGEAAQLQPAPTTTAAAFTDPSPMVAKAKAAGVPLHNCSTPAFNIDGGLSVACNGADDETIYFVTFADSPDKAAPAAASMAQQWKVHAGQGWVVSAARQSTLDSLVSALG